MNRISRVSIGAVLFCSVQISVAQVGQITVRVADEAGQIVSDAMVEAHFHKLSKPGWGWGASAKPNVVKGRTDTNGLCVLTGEGNAGDLAVAAFKDGYYGGSGYQVQFTNLVGTADGKWQPWNPLVKVLLRRVGEPIPMYAKRVLEAQVPSTGHPVGFDLMAGGWVAPHGNGQEADLLFMFSAEPERVHTNWYGSLPRVHRLLDYTLSISFPKQGDGVSPIPVPLQCGGSALRLSQKAPENNYTPVMPKRVYQQAGQPQHSDIREDQNYYFRVRTMKDHKGKIVSALYGKIYGDFQFDERGRVTFTYYLNPTPNDRNVEFDPAKNLFMGLPSREQVREP